MEVAVWIGAVGVVVIAITLFVVSSQVASLRRQLVASEGVIWLKLDAGQN